MSCLGIKEEYAVIEFQVVRRMMVGPVKGERRLTNCNGSCSFSTAMNEGVVLKGPQIDVARGLGYESRHLRRAHPRSVPNVTQVSLS